MNPLIVEPRIGFREDEQVVLDVGRNRVGRVDTPPPGNAGHVLAATVKDDDGRQVLLDRIGRHLNVVQAAEVAADLFSP